MKLYAIWPDDQKKYNWIAKRYVHPRGGEPGFKPLPVYRDYVCSACGSIDYDSVFAVGFPQSATKISAKGDLLITDDNFWCVRTNVVALFEDAGVQGVRFKQVDRSEWHVVNITQRLRPTKDVYRAAGEMCPKCRRNTDIVGTVESKDQLLDSPLPNSVFSTVEYREKADRDVLVDESVLSLLLKGKIEGSSATLIK